VNGDRQAAAGRVLSSLPRLLPRWADYAGLRRSWPRDLAAGMTVGVVALPLALGFGVASGEAVAHAAQHVAAEPGPPWPSRSWTEPAVPNWSSPPKRCPG
jgi:hypothetical protein